MCAYSERCDSPLVPHALEGSDRCDQVRVRGRRQGVAVVRARQHPDVPPHAGVEPGLQVERVSPTVATDRTWQVPVSSIAWCMRYGAGRPADTSSPQTMASTTSRVQPRASSNRVVVSAIEPGREGGANLPPAKSGERFYSARYYADARGYRRARPARNAS